MANEGLQTETGILSVAGKFAHYLHETRSLERTALAWQGGAIKKAGSLQWNNPENIESGTSGIILLLIELYRQTNDAIHLHLIDDAIEDLIRYCKEHSTYNYSLYTGRAGAAYVLMEYYRLTGRPDIPAICLDMLSSCTEVYLESEYTSDYLYNGRAGTLLVLLMLYNITGASSLLTTIDRFVAVIISHMHLSVDGCYWVSKEELNLRPSCGFAFGAAGIKYVLDRVARGCPGSKLENWTGEIERYINSCRVNEYGNWGNYERDITDVESLEKYVNLYTNNDPRVFKPGNEYGWASGTTGVCFALHNRQSKALPPLPEMTSFIHTAANGEELNYLYDGLAGMGLYYWEKDEPGCRFILEKIIAALTDKLLTEGDISCKGGLLHGKPGWLYFLLKTNGERPHDENILAPFLNVAATGKHALPALSMEATAVKKSILEKCYPRTVSFLGHIASTHFQEYLNKSFTGGAKELQQFRHFIESLHQHLQLAKYERLMDLFLFENAWDELKQSAQRSSYRLYIEEWVRGQKAMDFLARSSERLLCETLAISQKLTILQTKWDWSFEDEFGKIDKSHANNTTAPPAQFQYIIQLDAANGIDELFLRDDLLLLFRSFDRPKIVRQVLAEINDYIRSLSAPTLHQLLLKISETPNVGDYLDKLDNIILYEIRQWIMKGILVAV